MLNADLGSGVGCLVALTPIVKLFKPVLELKLAPIDAPNFEVSPSSSAFAFDE